MTGHVSNIKVIYKTLGRCITHTSPHNPLKLGLSMVYIIEIIIHIHTTKILYIGVFTFGYSRAMPYQTKSD